MLWRNVSRPGHLYPSRINRSLRQLYDTLYCVLRKRICKPHRLSQRLRILGKGKEKKRDIRIFRGFEKKVERQLDSKYFRSTVSKKVWNSIGFQKRNNLFVCFLFSSFFFNPLNRFRWVKLNKLEQRVIRLKNRDMSVNEPRLARCTVHGNFFNPLSLALLRIFTCKTAPCEN